MTEDLHQIDDDEATRIRIVPPKNLHITLKFLGSVLESQLDQIEAQLKRLASQLEPLELHCEGIGFFKNSMWLGIKPDKRLDAIAAQVNRTLSLQEIGTTDQSLDSRPYVPHVTVARFNRQAKPQLLPVLKKHADNYWGAMQVRQVHLYRSQTLDEGARYSIIDSYDLGGPI